MDLRSVVKLKSTGGAFGPLINHRRTPLFCDVNTDRGMAVSSVSADARPSRPAFGSVPLSAKRREVVPRRAGIFFWSGGAGFAGQLLNPDFHQGETSVIGSTMHDEHNGDTGIWQRLPGGR